MHYVLSESVFHLLLLITHDNTEILYRVTNVIKLIHFKLYYYFIFSDAAKNVPRQLPFTFMW